jgi:hypothetical protein
MEGGNADIVWNKYLPTAFLFFFYAKPPRIIFAEESRMECDGRLLKRNVSFEFEVIISALSARDILF